MLAEINTSNSTTSISDVQTESIICPLCSRRVMIVVNIKENWTKFYTLTSESDDEYQQQGEQQSESESSVETEADEHKNFCSSAASSFQVELPLNTKKRKMTMMLNCSTPSSSSNRNTKDVLEAAEEEAYTLVKCTSCDKSIGLINNHTAEACDEILHDATKPANGWTKAEGERDRRILFILSQIIYKEYEMPEESQLEVDFAFQPFTDLVKLLWINRTASGFFSMKLKGTLNLGTMETYSMATLDTLFIRKIHRRQGYATAALEDILTEFPEQNIGFSYPISYPMEKVLYKHLQLRPQDRLHFWEISGCGTQGNCRNLWLILQKTQKKKQKE